MQTRDRLSVGDHVTFHIGPTPFRARVIEDRGDLGVGGRQIVRLEVLSPHEPDQEPRQFEMPAEELTLERRAA